MSYTLAEAAQACGVNRSTILRSIKAGKISGQQDEYGAGQSSQSSCIACLRRSLPRRRPRQCIRTPKRMRWSPNCVHSLPNYGRSAMHGSALPTA